MENLSNFKYEYVEIKCETNHSEAAIQNLKTEPGDYISGSIVKESRKDICFDSATENLASIKCEDVKIKPEENYSETSRENLKDEPEYINELILKDEIKDVCDNTAIESLSIVKCEDVENISDENYSDTSFQNWEDEPSDTITQCQSKYVQTTNDSALMYKCSSCKYETNHKGNFIRHQQKHVVRQVIPKDRTHKCNVCDFKTIYKSRFIEHQLRHRNVPEDQMYKCDSCNYKTILQRNLTRHQLKHIPEGEMYKCDWCEYKTGLKSGIRWHERKHKEVPGQMYKCDSCNFETVYKNSLKQHLLKHKDVSEKCIYKCDSCDFQSFHLASLTRHQMKHRDIPEEQMYQCYSCDYKTCHRRLLVCHQMRHKDISDKELHNCDLCSYKTVHKHHLKRHQLVHKNSCVKM